MADYTGKEIFFTGMQDTNFEITSDELKAMQDTSFYKIKWKVTDKISTLFTELQSEIEANINNINNNIKPNNTTFNQKKTKINDKQR